MTSLMYRQIKRPFWRMLIIVLCLPEVTSSIVSDMTMEEQKKVLVVEKDKCDNRMKDRSHSEGLFCNMTWDDLMCWGDTPAGKEVQQPCPKYISGFNSKEFASRFCTKSGTWFNGDPLFNNTNGWTNYDSCLPDTGHFSNKDDFSEITKHMPHIRLMYNIGYGISLGSLIIAVIIMFWCRRLQCKSNTLHINLFFAFILRASLSFIKENVLKDGLGLAKDLVYGNDTIPTFRDGTHWECKLLVTLSVYTIAASHMWIFVEGLYLHMLVYRTLYTERKGVAFYVVFGWVSPFTFLIPWVIVRAISKDDNVLCWNTNPTPGYIWIYKGPVCATIVINFLFFVDILRVLVTRVRANKRVTGTGRIRKLAKFSLVLIPLFGVFYIVFMTFPTVINAQLDIPLLYSEMFYNSFQGFILAVLFCFLNEEVHAEFKRFWRRYFLGRNDSYAGITRSIVWTSWRRASYQSRVNHSDVHDNSRPHRNGQIRSLIKNNNKDATNKELLEAETIDLYSPKRRDSNSFSFDKGSKTSDSNQACTIVLTARNEDIEGNYGIEMQ